MNALQQLEMLGKTINVRIDKGDKAAKDGVDHFIAAGLHLKEAHKLILETKEMSWRDFISRHCCIGKTRVYQLMDLADGKTTVTAMRERSRESMTESRKRAAVRNVADKPKPPPPMRPSDIQAAHYRAACENFKALDDNWRKRFLENNGLAKTPRAERLAA